MPKNLKDTPFSIDRLFVWALSAALLIGMSGMIYLAVREKEIPPQIQSVIMICLGVFAARLEGHYKPPKE